MSHGTVAHYKVGTQRKWRFQFRTETGAQIRRRGFATRAEAVRAMELERERHVGLVDPSNVDVATYLRIWQAERVAIGAIGESTATSYAQKLRPVIERLGGRRLIELRAADLDDLYRFMLQEGGEHCQGLSARSVRYTHTVVRKALADACRKGLLGRNVADAADPPSPRSAKAAERKVWSAEEAARFLQAPWLPQYRRTAWELALRTGLRRGELCALRWDCFEDGCLIVRSNRTTVNHQVIETTPKTEKSLRSLLLDEDMQRRLRAWKAEQGALCIRVGHRSDFILTDSLLKEWHPNALSRAWVRDVKRARDEQLVPYPMRLHDCRHWHASQMVAAGVDLNTVADRLGHATPAFTLSVYGHSDARRDKAAAEAVSAALGTN